MSITIILWEMPEESTWATRCLFDCEAWVFQASPGEEVKAFIPHLVTIAESGNLELSTDVFIYDITAMTRTRYKVWLAPVAQPEGCVLKLIESKGDWHGSFLRE